MSTIFNDRQQIKCCVFDEALKIVLRSFSEGKKLVAITDTTSPFGYEFSTYALKCISFLKNMYASHSTVYVYLDLQGLRVTSTPNPKLKTVDADTVLKSLL